MNCQPNLFLIGAAKSGTTSLANYLSNKKVFYLPIVKEPFYFIEGQGVKNRDEYEGLFSKATTEKYRIDASIGYLFDKSAIENIKIYNSKAKIIFLLRNPIDMAWSYWKFMLANGSEKLNFYQAICQKKVEHRKSPEFKKKYINWSCSYLYVERAKYFGQVNSVINIFGKENIYINTFENCTTDFEKVTTEICNFINIEDKIKIGNEHLPKDNTARSRSNLLIFLRSSPILKPIKKIFKNVLSFEKRERIRKRILFTSLIGSDDNIGKMSEDNREIIKELFIEDVSLLKDLIPNVNFEKWADFLVK
jgi:hypothetical protein